MYSLPKKPIRIKCSIQWNLDEYYSLANARLNITKILENRLWGIH